VTQKVANFGLFRYRSRVLPFESPSDLGYQVARVCPKYASGKSSGGTKFPTFFSVFAFLRTVFKFLVLPVCDRLLLLSTLDTYLVPVRGSSGTWKISPVPLFVQSNSLFCFAFLLVLCLLCLCLYILYFSSSC